MSETFQTPDKSFFEEPRELGDLINKENLIHRYLPKQMDIDKILKVIQRKVLKGTHLLVEIKVIQAGKLAIKRVATLTEKYILLDSLLFKITPEKETAVLAIPETCIDKVITLYHLSLFAGYQGVIKHI